MNKTLIRDASAMASGESAASRTGRGWLRWAPYAAVAWSLIYAALGGYWAASGGGFRYATEAASDPTKSQVEQLGPGVAWAWGVAATMRE